MRVEKEMGNGGFGRLLQWRGALAVVMFVVLFLVAGCGAVQLSPQTVGASGRGVAEEIEKTPPESPTVEPVSTAEPQPEKELETVPVKETLTTDPMPRGGDIMTIGGRPTELIERAKAQVADLAGSSVASVQVVSVEAVDWPDASLGCPQRGMMYGQVITPGYRIVLEANGSTYEFHSDRNPQGPLVRCSGQARTSPPSSNK